MYSTKSFCNIFAFASNEPGVVSPIGELTTLAKTFTKELGIYRHPSLDGYDLLNFSSKNDDGVLLMLSAFVNEAVILVDKAVQVTFATVGEVFFSDLFLALQLKVEELNASSFAMGPMVSVEIQEEGITTRWMPEWISWSSSEVDGDNIHKVWLTLEAFKAQYTDYEIVVVPPLMNLNMFFNPGSIVETQVKAITPTQIMEQVELAKDGNPETLLRTDAYEFRDPVNSARRFDVYWTVVIYGPAGNDPDIIRDVLVEYIIANSDHTREEWALIFPDIFKRTEFIIAPFWDTYATEQRIFDHGIYSPILDHHKPQLWLQQFAEGYSAGHIEQTTQVMAFPYRSLQTAVIGHIENRDNKQRITDYFSDFINTGTDSVDFNRMSIPTQEWAFLIMELLIVAEAMNISTDLPRGAFRIKRGEITYVGKTHNRILYLVLAKSNTLEVLG